MGVLERKMRMNKKHKQTKTNKIIMLKLIFKGPASLDGVGFILPPSFLVIRQTLPAEGQVPVEVAPVVVLAVRRWLGELKSVEVDGGDVGAHDRRAVLHDPGQQRLQPPIKAFTCLDT